MNSATSFTYDEAYLSTLAGGWTKMSFPIISALVRDALRAFAPKRILDFGAGSGTYARVLSETGAEVVGCDASPACVAACEGKYASTFVIREIDELPREAFDLVFVGVGHGYAGAVDDFDMSAQPQLFGPDLAL